MTTDEWHITYVAGSFAILFALILNERLSVRRKARQPRIKAKPATFECSECHQEISVDTNMMRILEGPEMALIVSVRKDLVSRRLGEYNCPHCNAAHCFRIDLPVMKWVGANIFHPAEKTARCHECRRRLAIVQESQNGGARRLEDIRQDVHDVGLRCTRCAALCCIECSRKNSRGRGGSFSLVCPRCFREPMELLK